LRERNREEKIEINKKARMKDSEGKKKIESRKRIRIEECSSEISERLYPVEFKEMEEDLGTNPESSEP
jgi:hypothetical protein